MAALSRTVTRASIRSPASVTSGVPAEAEQRPLDAGE
jgi:hypothetical protein